MDHSNVQHHLTLAGLGFSEDADTVLDRNRGVNILPDDDKVLFQRSVWNFLDVQNAVASVYSAANPKLFDVTIKSHYYAHSAIQVVPFVSEVLLSWDA